jgi:hypothetical protein
LSSICNTVVKDELIERNPCMITGAMYAKTKSSISILEVGEIAALADAIKPERFKALILISAWCGLRYGEVTELRRKDIGEGAEVISIARGVVHREGCHISTPKSGKARTVVVPPHIRAEIKHRLDTFVAEDVEALLFPPVRSGCHLSDKVNRDALAPALKSVGCEGVRIHDLRHFSGTEVARVGNLVETMNHPGRHRHGFPALSAAFRRVQATSTGPVGAALACRECDRYAVRRCATSPIHTGRDRTAAPSGTRAAVSPCLLGPGMFSQGRFHAILAPSGRSAKERWQGKHFRHPRPTCR